MGNYKKLAMIICSIGLMFLLTGITYAYFNYSNTSVAQNLVVGDIHFNLNEGNDEIELTNVFPESASEARARNDNYITFSIDGLNTSNKTIYYEFILDYGETLSSPKSRYHDEDLRFDLVELDSNGNEVSYLLDAVGYDSIANKRIWVDTINSNTSNEVNRYYKLRVWLDESVIISDSLLTANYTATEYPNKYATILLKIVGDFSEKAASNSLYSTVHENAVLDNINSTYVQNTTPGIDFGEISSDTNGKGTYIRKGTENDTYPIVYYRGNVNNNVFFAGKCWKIVRTTDTGGTKLIYSGENTGTSEAPICNNTGSDVLVTLNIGGVDKTYIEYSGPNLYSSLAYVGYMYGSTYHYHTPGYETGSKFGNSVTWNGTSYTLTGVSDTLDENHHYTCATQGTTTCSTVRYYYVYYTSGGNDFHLSITLENGKKVEDAMTGMLDGNSNDSYAKTLVDTWYEENLKNTLYESQIEDTVYCNERSIYQIGGMNPNGGIVNSSIGGILLFSPYYRYASLATPSLTCTRKADSFTRLSNRGNGKLDYSVGMITCDEVILAGGRTNSENSAFYLAGSSFWTMSPLAFNVNGNAYMAYVYESGIIISNSVANTRGIRPVISLKLDTIVASGSGLGNDPYVIE